MRDGIDNIPLPMNNQIFNYIRVMVIEWWMQKKNRNIIYMRDIGGEKKKQHNPRFQWFIWTLIKRKPKHIAWFNTI